ncbi:MAG: LysM peptidoglycan-binding domain-containing protein, partial [Acidimicrobiales bacterium]
LQGYDVVPDHGGVETRPAARVRPFALSRFVIAYLVGWILTPIVALVHLAGGDLSDLERHGVLDRLVSWQRYGRAQSLRVLAVSVATAAGVTAAGGMTGTAMAAPAAASTSPQAGSTYTVQPGDTLGSIAAAHGTTVGALASANRVANPNLVYVGQVLTLPAGAGSPSTASGPSYTVQAGDTVGAIAERFGTTVASVASANHMVDANQISVGQVIVVAGGHTPATTAASTSGSSYTVQAGDTLNRIAARYGTTAAALASLNHIANPDVITVGQVLAVTGQAPAPAAAPAPVRAPAPAPATTVSFGYTLPVPEPAPAAPAAPTSAAATAVKVALAQIGKPYLYGGSGPGSFDCSGLVMYAYAAAGIQLPHYTVAQYQGTTHISQAQLQPGDLVFYGGSAPSHVAMYIGGGQVVSANTTGTTIQT